jgi:hypothetical protein
MDTLNLSSSHVIYPQRSLYEWRLFKFWEKQNKGWYHLLSTVNSLKAARVFRVCQTLKILSQQKIIFYHIFIASDLQSSNPLKFLEFDYRLRRYDVIYVQNFQTYMKKCSDKKFQNYLWDFFIKQQSLNIFILFRIN